MKNPDVHKHKQRLDNLFQQVENLPEDAPEIRAHWARYLCVLTCGFIEQSVRAVYTAYAAEVANPKVASYVAAHLERTPNPNMGVILQIAGQFSPEWKSELADKTEGRLKEVVNSIVANRHSIAHGHDVGITYVTISDYYRDAVKVIELIEEQCEG